MGLAVLRIKRRIAATIAGRRWLVLLRGPSRLLVSIGHLLGLLAWTAEVDLRTRLLDAGQLPQHGHRSLLYQHLLNSRGLQGIPVWYLEFGVAEGESIRWWSTHNTHPDSRFMGHDSFEGLPEAWALTPKGGFSTGGTAPVIDDSRVSFVKGWFKDTVGHGLPSRPTQAHLLVVNLDADLYGSTAICLHALYPHLRNGDLLIFDELAYPMHEFRSFQDFKESFGLQLTLVAAVNCGDVSAFEVGMS